MARVLVLNAGSSSLKASLVDVGQRQPVARVAIDWGSDASRAKDRRESVEAAMAGLAGQVGQSGQPSTRIEAVGHRLVHGGERFRQPVVLDDGVLAELDELSGLAPLHNPLAVETARAAREVLPEAVHVAAFDTAFHAGLPEEGYVYALPWHWHAEWGVRRYGFHGLAVEWAVLRAGELLSRPAGRLALVVAHLGSGCSATAVLGGRSVATSMGFTPLEGLAMGTRAGSVDPGVLLHALRRRGLDADELAEVLDHGSGLLGLSGLSGDVRQLEAAAADGQARPRLALDVFSRRAAEGIAAAAVALPRLDALVFSGGIGEHAGALRARIVERLGVLGVPAVPAEESGLDRLLTPAGAHPAVLRVEAREDLVIAHAAVSLLG